MEGDRQCREDAKGVIYEGVRMCTHRAASENRSAIHSGKEE
jgi:hypothetical protein